MEYLDIPVAGFYSIACLTSSSCQFVCLFWWKLVWVDSSELYTADNGLWRCSWKKVKIVESCRSEDWNLIGDVWSFKTIYVGIPIYNFRHFSEWIPELIASCMVLAELYRVGLGEVRAAQLWISGILSKPRIILLKLDHYFVKPNLDPYECIWPILPQLKYYRLVFCARAFTVDVQEIQIELNCVTVETKMVKFKIFRSPIFIKGIRTWIESDPVVGGFMDTLFDACEAKLCW